MSENEPQKPKIIVDEDWKAQVEREKSEAARQQQPSTAASGHSAAQSRPEQEQASRQMPLPPANFPMLVTTLATQAMAAMGQIPDASGKPSAPQPELARHFIDILGMLEEKTQGNLTPHESRVLTDILHELRMAFVQIQKSK